MGRGDHFRSRYYHFTVEDCAIIKLGSLKLRKVLQLPDPENYYSLLHFYRDCKFSFTRKCYIERILLNGNEPINYLMIQDLGGYTRVKIGYGNIGEAKYGGRRPMLICPICRENKFKLYLKPLAYASWRCRDCLKLTYESCKASRRPSRFECSVLARIGGGPELMRQTVSYYRKLRNSGNYFIEEFIKVEEKEIMRQTGFKLTDKQIKDLATLSKETGLGKSELIRRALDHYLEYRKMQKAKIVSMIRSVPKNDA